MVKVCLVVNTKLSGKKLHAAIKKKRLQYPGTAGDADPVLSESDL